jgi:endonuclease/exonuclease/phosphatase family metal-dependent hydrolase
MRHVRLSTFKKSYFDDNDMAARSSETSLTLASYNVAGCNPSQGAPSTWTKSDSLRAIEKEFFQNENKPDIIALQYIPSFAMETMLSEYNLIGCQLSHAPYVALFVHQKWNAKQVHKNLGQLPAVMAEIDFSFTDDVNEVTSSSKSNLPPRRLWIASVYLDSCFTSTSIRKQQLQALADQARSEKVPLIIAGDTNMRVAEDHLAEIDLGMHDFSKLAGSDIRTKFTVSALSNATIAPIVLQRPFLQVFLGWALVTAVEYYGCFEERWIFQSVLRYQRRTLSCEV